MKNLLINYLSGDKIFESLDIEIYFDSLKKINNADKFVIVNNISDKNIKLLEKKYDKIIYKETSFYYLYYKIHEVLMEDGQDYEYALYVDTRDVIIQKNPFDYFASKPDKDLFLVCEGMKSLENECNLYWHQLLSSTQIFPNQDGENNLVINGGTIGGRVPDYMNMLLLAMTNSNRKSSGVITDQSIYTSLYPYLQKMKNVELCHPYTDTFCCTGEAIKRNNIDIFYDGQYACNEKGEPYCLFHQWDRTELAGHIRKKHESKLTFSI
jgi:hypothetical protein